MKFEPNKELQEMVVGIKRRISSGLRTENKKHKTTKYAPVSKQAGQTININTSPS